MIHKIVNSFVYILRNPQKASVRLAKPHKIYGASNVLKKMTKQSLLYQIQIRLGAKLGKKKTFFECRL